MIQDNAELYGIGKWGRDYFDINDDGEVRVLNPNLPEESEGRKGPTLTEILRKAACDNVHAPVLLRFPHLVAHRVSKLNRSFADAIERRGYPKPYRGVFPIKVNQQRPMVEAILTEGRQFHHGLEAGSKSELAASLSLLQDREAYLICNGKKDAAYVDLALAGMRIGLKVILVIESPLEVTTIAERAKAIGVAPRLGVRARLRTRVPGNEAKSKGEQTFFGLDASELMRVVRALDDQQLLGCLEVLHFHQTSQIPELEAIRASVREACRFYAELVRLKAPMVALDVGGGLAVNYDASRSAEFSSKDYSMDDYADSIVREVAGVMAEEKIEPPILISESGRAVVAAGGALVFPVMESEPVIPIAPVGDCRHLSASLAEMMELLDEIAPENLARTLNTARARLEHARNDFSFGRLSLDHLTEAEACFGAIAREALAISKEHCKTPPPEVERVRCFAVDFYFGSFSVFQSVPDLWGIKQIFPVMPIHRLAEKPEHSGVLVDLTCDPDGCIESFGGTAESADTLALHDLKPDEPYYIGVFLLGAYQEVLGDRHNLYGGPHVVDVHLKDDGGYELKIRPGEDTLSVLSFAGYQRYDLMRGFERSVLAAAGQDPAENPDAPSPSKVYEQALADYTYYNVYPKPASP
ncbi:MAG: arginine decarboxylase [Verrucomicrobiales bacterium]|jgi:arginine decarboxylase